MPANHQNILGSCLNVERKEVCLQLMKKAKGLNETSEPHNVIFHVFNQNWISTMEFVFSYCLGSNVFYEFETFPLAFGHQN
jgi:hypothetical protein